jgi:hypothetical protein
VGAELLVHGGDLRIAGSGSPTLFRASPFESVLYGAKSRCIAVEQVVLCLWGSRSREGDPELGVRRGLLGRRGCGVL